MKYGKLITAAVAAALLAAGCDTNGGSMKPSVTQANLGQDKLEFAVGTANIGFDDASGLNVVATLRQPNGLSAVLLDTPTITGPEGFTVPSCGAPPCPWQNDVGTDHLSGAPQAVPGTTPQPTTFSDTGGVFSYGFGPFNSVQQGTAFYPGNPPMYGEPFFSSSGGIPVVGGPPAYPFFNDGSFPAGFEGYSQGFTAFETGVVAGAYNLSVHVPIANAPSVNFSGSATITDTTLLGLPSAPALVEDGAGGGTISATVASDGRITETLLYVDDLTSGLFFTVGPFAGNDEDVSGNLPDDLGACVPVGCRTGATMAAGDNYVMWAISYDYPAFESSPPGNRAIAPTITGANGQADIAISGVSAEFTYGGGGAHTRHPFRYHPPHAIR